MRKLLACLMIMMLALPLTAVAEGSPVLRFVPAEEEAFNALTEGAVTRLMGASGDGRMLLMVNPYELYLWDRTAHARVPVTFARPEDAETVTDFAVMTVIRQMGRDLNAQQRAEKEAALRQSLAEQGTEAFTDMDRIFEQFPRIFALGVSCLGLSRDWALVSCDQAGFALAVDLRSGAGRIFGRDEKPRSLCGSRVLLQDMRILDLETGECALPELMPAPDDGRPELNPFPCAMHLCANGDVLAVLDEGSYSQEGNDCWLVDAAADSNRAIRIGHTDSGRAPNVILTAAGERWLLLFNRAMAIRKGPFILDRVSGEARETEDGQFLPVAAAENGFLCWDLQTYRVFLLDPADGGRTPVSLAPGFNWASMDLTGISSMVGNGLGMYFVPDPSMSPSRTESVAVHGYFVLEGE